MQLVTIGVSHKTAPLHVLERAAVSSDALDHALERLKEHTSDGFILSTCNRTEIYAVLGHQISGSSLLTQLLTTERGFTAEEIERHVYVLGHEAAIGHLFAVASGVDSMVPGEDQVLGQLRTALQHARARDLLGPFLHRLGTTALAVGKRVRARTHINKRALSVPSVALQVAGERLGGLRGRSVLVIGTGNVAALTLERLQRHASASVLVCGRASSRAAELAGRFSADVLRWDDRLRALREVDLAVFCSGGPGLLVSRDDLEAVSAERSRPVVLVDIAVPRNVDAAAAGLANVAIISLEHVERVCESHRAERSQQLALAQNIIDTESERFLQWWHSREITPAIRAILARADGIREAEVKRALTKLGPASEKQREIVSALASRITGKLLYEPLKLLKSSPEGANMAQMLLQLFGLVPHADFSARAPHSVASETRVLLPLSASSIAPEEPDPAPPAHAVAVDEKGGCSR